MAIHFPIAVQASVEASKTVGEKAKIIAAFPLTDDESTFFG